MTVTPLEWKFRRWRLREGEYAPPWDGPRPADLPARIPTAWWVRLAAFVARRKAAQQPVKPAHDMWLQDGVYARRFGNFANRDQARAAGFRWLVLQLDHSQDALHNAASIDQARAEGWIVGGWATFGQAAPAREDGKRQANIVHSLGLDLWVANGEAWAEGVYAGRSQEWWDGWDSEGGTGPVALTCLSSTTANYGREMDWQPWVYRRCSIQPQVYGASHAAYTVGAMAGSFARTSVPAGLLAPVFDVIAGHGPFEDYRTWGGPRSIYTGDDARLFTWGELAW